MPEGLGALSDVPRLEQAFEDGALLRPDWSTPNLVDLARAIAGLADIEVAETPVSAALRAEIGASEHLVAVLVDGLGATHLEGEAGASFLRTHLRRTMLTAWPSTTAVALTSFVTGEWPARHALTGWWGYLPSIAATATLLPFTRRGDDRPLDKLGVAPEQAYPLPSLWARSPRDLRVIQPRRIAGTPYSQYASGYRDGVGYGTLRSAFDAVLAHLEEADGPTLTYLYLPHVDAAAHEYGLGSAEVHGALLAIDAELARLATLLDGRARIVLTADHGHLAVPDEQRHRVRAKDPLAAHFRAMPSGDMRAVSFHIEPGHLEEFAREFRGRLGHRFALITPDELEGLQLLGPVPLAEETRRRLGDCIALSLGIDILGYIDANNDRHALKQPSHHSGLTRDEMLIPLVLA